MQREHPGALLSTQQSVYQYLGVRKPRKGKTHQKGKKKIEPCLHKEPGTVLIPAVGV